jgi:hypothetical protein
LGPCLVRETVANSEGKLLDGQHGRRISNYASPEKTCGWPAEISAEPLPKSELCLLDRRRTKRVALWGQNVCFPAFTARVSTVRVSSW